MFKLVPEFSSASRLIIYPFMIQKISTLPLF